MLFPIGEKRLCKQNRYNWRGERGRAVKALEWESKGPGFEIT